MFFFSCTFRMRESMTWRNAAAVFFDVTRSTRFGLYLYPTTFMACMALPLLCWHLLNVEKSRGDSRDFGDPGRAGRPACRAAGPPAPSPGRHLPAPGCGLPRPRQGGRGVWLHAPPPVHSLALPKSLRPPVEMQLSLGRARYHEPYIHRTDS
jgi:hypothetical protein